MKPRVVICSELFYPDDGATAYVLTRVAEGLAGSYDVHVLCGQAGDPHRRRWSPVRERRRGMTIERCATTFFDKNVVVLRLINLVTISISMFLKALFGLRRRDIVFVVTNPPALPYLVLLACRLRGARCMLIVHDVYPDVLVATGLLRDGSMMARFLRWLNTIVLPRFDEILVLGRDMQKLVEESYMQDLKKTRIITNWADVDTITPKPKEQTRLFRESGLEGQFVIQYSGNMGRTHGLETILEAAVALKGDRFTHMLLIGAGAKKRGIDAYLASARLTNVTLLPMQPRENLADTLNACDVAIISFISGIAGISVPSRMYNIMAAGKPIIAVADEDSELATVVREEQIGWVVAPGDVATLVEVIRRARSMRRELRQMSIRARSAAQRYSYERIIDSYRGLVDRQWAQQPDHQSVTNGEALRV